MVLNAEDLYQLLEVSQTADLETIRHAFRAQCKKWHPDTRQGLKSDGAETMIRLNKAWEVLGSSDMRQAYDWLTTEPIHETAF